MRLGTRVFKILGFVLLVLGSGSQSVHAENLTLTVGGKVSAELLAADAFLSNTLSIVSPTGIKIVATGCKLTPAPQLTGLQFISEKKSQRGCRVDFDFNGATPTIDPFPAGTEIEFNMCAQVNADPNCDHIWSSDPNKNSDGFDHVETTAVHETQLPGRIFHLGWEDTENGGDLDFNDIVATIRVTLDSDGDGLWDDWELFGIDINGDGIIDLDLPNLLPVDHDGDPNTPPLKTNRFRPDLFIEIDYMDCSVAGGDCSAGDSHSHVPKSGAIDALVQTFLNAPVTGPDPDPNNNDPNLPDDPFDGILLHVDVDDKVKHVTSMPLAGSGCEGDGDPNLTFTFDDVKEDTAYFGKNNPRRFAFRYLIMAHFMGKPNPVNGNSTGCGEYKGNDVLVSMGRSTTAQKEAGTILHELGHALGLAHGGLTGGVNDNYKPNYISIMNYSFQLSGIGPDPDGGGPLTRSINYSPYHLPDINENDLDEPTGLGIRAADGDANDPGLDPADVLGDPADTTKYSCPGTTSLTRVAAAGPIDWNCDGLANDPDPNDPTSPDPLVQNVNGSGGGSSTLKGDSDWDILHFPFQSDGDFEDGVHDDVVSEATFQEIFANSGPFTDAYKCYRSRDTTKPRFQKLDVSLDDQFFSTIAQVKKPIRLCNAAEVDGSEIEDSTAHLNCYKIKEPRTDRKRVLITNAFGVDQEMRVHRADSLCVPAELNEVESNLSINHFKCYRVAQKGFEKRDVILSDEFEQDKLTEVQKPKFMCNPVDKNGEGIPDAQNHVVCYRLKDRSQFFPMEVTVSDQFVEDDPLVIVRRNKLLGRSLLCLPSTKTEIPW